jgi:hypothetical protein
VQIVVETGSSEPQFYTHEIQVKSQEEDPYETIHIFSGFRDNVEVLTYPSNGMGFIPGVRYVRVHVTEAPGWVALYELRALLPQDRSAYDVPAPPIITYPRPGIDDNHVSMISWKNDPSSLPATLQISFDFNFTSLAVEVDNLTTGQYDVSWLPEDQRYYWRVRERNVLGSSYWSVIGRIDKVVVSTRPVPDPSWLSIAPNPVRDQLHLSFSPQITGHHRAEIVNVMGQVVRVFDILGEDMVVDVSGLGQGLYFVRVDGRVVGRWVKMPSPN